MKIGIHTTGNVGVEGRGIGAYTKYLFDSLSRVSGVENFSVDLLDTNKLTESEILEKFDLIHYPSFDFFYNTLRPCRELKFVVTIHDTIPLIYPKHYPPGLRGSINLIKQRHALKKASAIITDSRTSQKDIVRFLHIQSSNIFPIYLGPTKTSSSSKKSEIKTILNNYNINFEYVVYIGDVNWNKNLPNLATACEKEKIHLVILGKRAVDTDFDKKHIENASLLYLQDKFADSKYIHRVGFVSDKDAEIIIKSSMALCQPSFYEGFGLNVLDAMVLGVPTICARTQTLVELYESASVFFDPYNVEEMGKVIKNLITNSKLMDNLKQKGHTLANKYSWEKTALETLEVYKRVIK